MNNSLELILKRVFLPVFFIFIGIILLTAFSQPVYSQTPIITSITPSSGVVGSSVTLTGANFDPVPSNNTVIFGGVRASVTAASTTSLTVSVPLGAAYSTISVTKSGLTATSAGYFTVTFPGGVGSTMSPPINDSVGNNPLGVAVGDFNGDGKLDMAVANSGSNSVSILLGTGAGTFGAATNYSVGSSPYGITVGDFNGDGNLDVAVTDYSGNAVSVLLGTGTGTFGVATNYPVGFFPFGIAVGDFNGDGKLDLAVTNLDSDSLSILIGTGTGTFGTATNYAVGHQPGGIVVGDFNGDGKPDVAVANQQGGVGNNGSVSILLGNGDGTFGTTTNYNAGSAPNSITAGDFNGDGILDLAVTSSTGNNNFVSVILGSGTGTFGAATQYPGGNTPLFITTGDFNGDGKLDVALANQNGNSVSILLGTGTGAFDSASNYPVGVVPYGITVGDFNGDGRADLAVANYLSSNVSVLLNVPPGFYTILSGVTGGNGTITPLGATAVNQGNTQVYTLTPNTGYHIDSVFVDGSYIGNTSPDTISNVTSNHTISAKFAVNTYTITSSVTGGNGTINPSGTTNVNYGGSQVYTLTPNTGYHIDSVFVDGSYIGNTSPDTISNVTANHTIDVKFRINSYTITSSVTGGNGTINPSGTTNVNYGGSQVYTLTPNTGYHIDSVFVDGSYIGNTSPDTISNVTANHTIDVKFRINSYTITSSVTGGNGTINPSGTTNVNYGGSQVYTLTPNTGYHIDSVFVDGSYIGNTSPDTISNVTSNHTISAKFAVNTYTITSSVTGGNGTINPSGTTNVNYGGSQVYTLTPNTGYHIDSVFVDGSYIGNTSPDTISNVTSNHTISAKFAVNTYTITSSVTGGNGTINPSGTTNVNYGGSQVYTLTPNTGYHIDSVFVDGSYIGNTSPDTIKNVTTNHTMTVKYSINAYTITSSVTGGNGTINPSGTTNVNYGGSQVYTLTPNTGYHIDSVFVDGSYIGNTSPDTIKNVTTNHTMTVKYSINAYTITSSVTGGNGTINPSGTTNVNYGGSQVYTLTPNTGYHIDSVFIDGSYIGNTSPDTIKNVTTNHTITVKYSINAYTITSSVTGGNGTINPSGTTNVNYGGSQVYTLTPNTGYHIDSVFVDGSYVGNASPDTISNVTSNHTISAKFAVNTYTITSSVTGGNGTINPSGTTNVNYGGSQVYTLTPNTGYHIDSVFIDGSYVGNASPDTISNVTSNHTISAKFAVNTYTITSSVTGGNGTINPSGTTNVNYGGSQVYTLTPNTGYHIDSVFVDGSYTGNTSPDTIKNVTTNHTITVKYSINAYTITSSVTGGNGTINPSGTTNVNYGGSQVYTLTPNTGYHIDSVFVDGSYIGNTSPDTIKNVTTNHTMTVKYSINAYTITSSVTGGNGTINPSGTTNVNYGGSQVYTLTPNTGYHIDSVFVDGSYTGNTSPDTIKNVTTNHTITVKYSINAYTITSSVTGGNGTINPSGTTNVNYGGSQVYTLTPNTGYHIDSVFVDGSYIGNTSPDTIKNVTTNHTMTVKYSINAYTITSSVTGGNGTINPSGTTNVNYGGSQVYTLTPNTGYHIDSVFVDGSYIGNTSPDTISNVTSNHTISAKFAVNTYTITSSVTGGNGTINPSGTTNVNYGGSQVYTLTPNTGYHIDSVFVDGSYIGNTSPDTIKNVTTNHTITVKYSINAYTITSSVTGGNGTINPSGTTNVNYGGSQVYTLTPNTGYHIDSVFVDGSYIGNTSPDTISNVTSNHTISAKFAVNTYTITSSVTGGNGTINPSGTTNVNYGGSQVYTLTPNTGYHIDSVFVDGSYIGNTSPDTIKNVTTNHTMTVKYSINAYTITSSVTGGNGTINPSGTTNVNYGGSQVYTLTPNTGYHIDSVFVDGSYIGNTSPDTISNVTSNHTISAKFAVNTYTITSSVTGGNGTINPSGTTNVNYGGSQVYTLTPNTGYHIDSVFVDGSYIGNTSPDTIKNVTTNHTMTVKYSINAYTITSSVTGGNGTINPSGTTNVNYGGSQVYTLTPNTGYHIDSVFVDGSYTGNTSPDTISNVTSNHTISAKFAVNTYTITSSVTGGNGTINPSGATNVNYGGSQVYTLTPNTGYHIDSVFVDGSYTGNTSPDTIKNVTTNHTITVKYSINAYTITSSVTGGNGTINPSGTTNVNYGGSQVYTLTPNTGYHIDSVFVDGNYIGNTSPDTISNVTSNHTISAKFAVNTYTITSSVTGGNGTINPSGTTNVNYGGSQVYTLTPNTGYHIDSVFVDGSYTGNTSPDTIKNVTTNHTITVKYSINAYTITSSVTGGNGTINPSGTTNVNYGGSQVYTLTPNTGYHIDSVFVDGNYIGNTSPDTISNVIANHTISVSFKNIVYTTTMHLSADYNPSVYGQTVTFTDSVISGGPTPHGTVVFFDGATVLDTAVVNNSGAATFATSGLSVGAHLVTGVYSGDANHNGSISDVLSDTVKKAATTTSVSADLDPSVYGQNITFTATISVNSPGAGTPTGNVQFFDGANSLGIVAIVDGKNKPQAGVKNGLKVVPSQVVEKKSVASILVVTARLSLSTLNAGVHSITAIYLDDANFTGSASGVLSDTVNKVPTIIAASANPNPSMFGHPDTLKATVASPINPLPGIPTGTVIFMNGSVAIDTAVLDSSGQATFITSSLTVGVHSIIAIYQGDANFSPSGSIALSDTVNQPTGVIGGKTGIPKEYAMYQNYPNPFNPTTKLQFDIPQLSMVTLKVYNILGQEVATPVSHESMEPGVKVVQLDGSNLASGLYFYRITAEGVNGKNFVSIKKMLLVK